MLERDRFIARSISCGLIVLSALINIPRMFAISIDFHTGCRRFRDYAKKGTGWFGIYSYVRLACLNCGSIVLLTIFNILLIFLVHRSSKRSHRDSVIRGNKSSKDSQQRSLTLTLIAATLLALGGEIPSTMFNRTSAGVLWGSTAVLNEQPFRSLILLAYTLLLIEYGGNFVTYFLLNKKFRALLLLKLCPKWSAKIPVINVEGNRVGGSLQVNRQNRLSTTLSVPLLKQVSSSPQLLHHHSTTGHHHHHQQQTQQQHHQHHHQDPANNNNNNNNNNNEGSNNRLSTPNTTQLMPIIDEEYEHSSSTVIINQSNNKQQPFSSSSSSTQQQQQPQMKTKINKQQDNFDAISKDNSTTKNNNNDDDDGHQTIVLSFEKESEEQVV